MNSACRYYPIPRRGIGLLINLFYLAKYIKNPLHSCEVKGRVVEHLDKQTVYPGIESIKTRPVSSFLVESFKNF